MRKIWDKFVKWLLSIPRDKELHFVAGLIVAAFFSIVWGFPLPILAAALAGLVKEAFDKYSTGLVEWSDFFYTLAGGLVIQIFALVALVA